MAALIVGLALGLASCGGGGGTSGAVGDSGGGAGAAGAGARAGSPSGAGSNARTGVGAGAQTGTATTQAAAVKAKAKKSTGGGSGHAGGCAARLGDFLARMDDLRQSLLAGLSYSEYVVRVQAIRAAYEAVPVDRLGVACLAGAATDAERAFNQYLRAADTWGECAATAGCAASEVEARLQHRWRIASERLDAARRPG